MNWICKREICKKPFRISLAVFGEDDGPFCSHECRRAEEADLLATEVKVNTPFLKRKVSGRKFLFRFLKPI